MEAAIPKPTTVRVSTGSIMPSSHSRAVLVVGIALLLIFFQYGLLQGVPLFLLHSPALALHAEA